MRSSRLPAPSMHMPYVLIHDEPFYPYSTFFFIFPNTSQGLKLTSSAKQWVYDRQCNEIGARSTSDPLIQDDITLIETSLGCDIFLAWRDPPAFTYWNFNFNGSCNCVLSEGQAPGDKVWTCPFVCMDFCSDPITDPSHETVSQTKVGGVGALMRRE